MANPLPRIEEPKDLIFRRHRPIIIGVLSSKTRFPQVLVEIITDYITSKDDVFGATGWARVFGVDIGEEPELPVISFYQFWFRKDPSEPTKQVCETHLPPILRPRIITYPDKSYYYYSLNALEKLIQNPCEGYHHSQYKYPDSEALKQHRKTKAGKACWLVMRKDVIARNKTYAKQQQAIRDLRAGYEEQSSILDLATVTSVFHAQTGKRHLGDDTGEERGLTYARGKELVRYGSNSYQATTGGFSEVGSFVEGFAPPRPVGLSVDLGNFDNECIGVVALRKF